jgi:DNA-binding NarL/FixJ family response regulator
MSTDQTWSPGLGAGRPRLLIADDDPVVRAALKAQLGGDFDIVGAAEDAIEAVKLAQEHQPDAALIDVDMPGGGAIQAVPQIAKRSPRTCMVILSSDESPELVVGLLSAGAIAYVRKGVGGPELAKTLAASLKARADQPAG